MRRYFFQTHEPEFVTRAHDLLHLICDTEPDFESLEIQQRGWNDVPVLSVQMQPGTAAKRKYQQPAPPSALQIPAATLDSTAGPLDLITFISC